MTTRRLDVRRHGTAIVFGLILAMVAAGTVAASDESSSGGTVPGCDGGVCTNLISSAQWSVAHEYGEGTHFWAVRYLRLKGILSQAKAPLAHAGVEPLYGMKVEALNSSGAVVKTITLTHGYYCGFPSAGSPADVSYSACRSYVELPLTVTRLRFIIKIDDPGVLGVGWARTWTAPIQ